MFKSLWSSWVQQNISREIAYGIIATGCLKMMRAGIDIC